MEFFILGGVWVLGMTNLWLLLKLHSHTYRLGNHAVAQTELLQRFFEVLAVGVEEEIEEETK